MWLTAHRRAPSPSSKHRLVLAAALSLLLRCHVAADGKIPGVEVSVPPSHTALSGDLHIQIASTSFPPLLLQLSRLEGDDVQTLATFPVLPEARALTLNTTLVKIPCGYFSKGGQYYVLLKKQKASNNGGSSNATAIAATAAAPEDDVITRGLDVRWPMPQLSLTPEYVQTYPERPVMAILEFPEVVCPPVADSPPSAIPEFWLELHYCGHSLLTCDNSDSANNTSVQVLYSEQIRGFPGRRVITLRCELFGLAGHYSLILRPTIPTPSLPHTAAYVKADWSEQFVFNVHARSIFPCETHTGIPVLFQYPSCILTTGDRVRLFARLRANVASLTPPTSLEYVAEQRVQRGRHSLQFECDLFSERYVEYCFVYVSQAITGAVADVRMDCVPTLPVTESESGGWGPWSPWTPCSSTCIGGTRNRYRFCDSPPPRYGAKFCEGPRVETEKCGTEMGNSWECFYGNGISPSDIAAEIPEVQAEIGPYCRCGCVVHLGHAKPKRLLATSSQSCPGRTFWLIQADEDFIIQFKVEQFHLPCGIQWLKVRDGRSLSSTLLADLSGMPEASTVNSTGPNLLLEFYTDEVSSSVQFCGGGFLAHAEQIRSERNLSIVSPAPIAQGIGVLPLSTLKLTAVHMAAVFFLSGLLISTLLLGAQYMLRYRKYHIAQAEDHDSFADISESCATQPLTTRVASNATLLSEVISLRRLRPCKNKHSKLRESVDCERNEEVTLAEEESLSVSSTMTLTQQDTSFSGLPQTLSEAEEMTCSLPSSPHSYSERTLKRSSTIVSSEKDKGTEKEKPVSVGGSVDSNLEAFRRRLSNVSTATLTNGSYSPAASVISRATIRSTNPKESKDKRNRERLLAGPGSDFSISVGDVDLEMDYYDYNVVNAGAAPGSYLGMDPAFLVWIPPLEEGEIELDTGFASPGSNKESPEEEEQLLANTLRPVSESTPKVSPLLPHCKKSKRIHPLVIVDNKTASSSESVQREDSGSNKSKEFERAKQELRKTAAVIKVRDQQKVQKRDNVKEVAEEKQQTIVSIQLHEFPKKIKIASSPIKVHMKKEEKISKISKASAERNFDEIKFADEDDSDEVQECNASSYQDSNVLST